MLRMAPRWKQEIGRPLYPDTTIDAEAIDGETNRRFSSSQSERKTPSIVPRRRPQLRLEAREHFAAEAGGNRVCR